MSTAAKKANPYTIRTLKAGEPIPTGEPHRYPSSHGYVRLRWTVAPYQLVEVYEHRVIDGHVTEAEQVHHRNGNKADNDPANLAHLSEVEHHRQHRKVSADRLAAMYAAGMSTPQIGAEVGLDGSHVYRLLDEAGVTFRSSSEANRRDTPDDLIRDLHRQGVRARAIAQRLGVSDTLVRARFREMGLASFPTGRPPR